MENETKVVCYDNEKGVSGMLPYLFGGGIGQNQWMNNPFAYLMFMLFANRLGFGRDGEAAGHNAQLASLQNEMQDNHNADLLMSGIKGNASAIEELANKLNCDFNTLYSCCCDLRQAVQQVAGNINTSTEHVINAVNMGDCNVIQALKDCCCNVQRQIADFRADVQLQNCNNTAALRNGQRDLGVAMAKGFSDNAYETQKQTCDIIQAINAAQQRNSDQMNAHWNSELQQKYEDAKTELSQQRQNLQFQEMLDRRERRMFEDFRRYCCDNDRRREERE